MSEREKCFEREFDFSKAVRNPYAKALEKPITRNQVFTDFEKHPETKKELVNQKTQKII